jgi:Tfp pilus assembly protein PilF
MIRRFTTTTGVLLLAAGLGWAVGAQGPGADAAREAAYRQNNLGVALLEQYNHKEAAGAFQRALEADPDFALAQVNHAIALFYIPDLAAAKVAATEALARQPDSLHLHYILALIARLEDQPPVAEAHLRKVLAADPGDFGANLVLGQLLVDEERYDEALPILELAAEADPVNASAAYSKAMALGRSGRREEAMQAMKHFQALRANPAHTSFGKIYLEQGRYAEAVASTGAEDEVVDPATPKVAFEEAEGAVPARPGGDDAVTLALADLDGDGRLDAIETSGAGVRLLKNEGGRFRDVTAGSGVSGPATAGVGADYDNDGLVDILLVRPTGLVLYRNEGEGRFADATAMAGLPARGGLPATTAFADVDHDGDLDVFVPGLLLRNNGDGTFADVSGEAGIAAEGEPLAVVPTDFDNGRDLDLFVLRRSRPPLLFRNRRDGSFEDVAARVGLGEDGPFRSVAVGDINKDFSMDLVLGTGGTTSTLALSDGRGRFQPVPGPSGSGAAEAVQAFDYDNDGLLDLLVATERGPRLFRHLGGEWADVTEAAFPAALRQADLGGAALAVADLDADGDADALVATPGGTSLWVNEGGNRNRSFAVDLEGRVSSKGGVGAKVALRAGSLKQKIETSAAVPMVAPGDVVFGLGSRPGPDTVRIIWVSGIVQTETEFPEARTEGTRTATHLLELDRKPSSCPYLYAWDGERFAFVTDFLGAGEMGYWVAPGVRSHPDPVEYVRLAPGQLRPRNGRYEVRVTNELEEVLYLDRVRLLAVDHPVGVEVYPDEGMTETPKPFRLFTVEDARVPRVVDAAGRDATERARSVDQRFVEGFALHRIRGYAAEHTLTLDLTALPATHRVLLLTGWTDYAFSSDNVAASQMGLALQPPRLEVEVAPGRWEVAVPDVGIPVGRPQTVVVDLAPLALGPTARVRLVTNMRIYWDRIAVGKAAQALPLEPVPLDPLVAHLEERGFSKEVFVDGRGPLSFDYARVTWVSPWKVMPGRYTALGDVRTLLGETDDLFVVSKPGDEIALSFEAPPPPAAGTARTFLLLGDGFSKEMDINSASPDIVLPLPYHGMESYPYAESDRSGEPARRAERQARHDTRVVARPLLPLELAALPERTTGDR